jgi:hypothetical protein
MTTKAIVSKAARKKLLAKRNAQANKELMLMLRSTIETQNRLVGKIEKRLLSGNVESVVPLLRKVERLGEKAATLHRFNAISLGQLFQLYTGHWESLPTKFTNQYDGGVYTYIQQKYGYGQQMADMYAKVWDAFFSGRYISPNDIPPFVKMSQIPIAKLAIASAYIRDGEMTNWRWKLLANEELEREELARDIRKGTSKEGRKVGRPPKEERVVLIKETGDLRLYGKGGEIEEVGFLNIKSKSAAVKHEIKLILKRNKIQVRR